MKKYPDNNFRFVLLCLSLFFFVSASNASAATFNVTKTADTNDGTCDSDCSLREAIRAANLLAGADVINLPAGTYTTTIAPTPNENANANGDFDMTDSVRIIGAGSATTFVQANASPGLAAERVFHILGTASVVVIEGVTVRNGRTPSTASIFFGAGIRNEGNLTLRNAIVTNNETIGRAGGIFSVGSGTFLSLDRVTVSNNKVTSTISNTFGGGVFSNLSTVKIRKSVISSNESKATVNPNLVGNGGGFYALDGDVTIKDSTITNNSIQGTSTAASSDGAGLRFIGQLGPMNIVLDNLTITNNQVLNGSSAGAGINVGVVGADTITFNLSNSTVSGNSVASSINPPLGAGLFSAGSGLVNATVTNTNFINNTATSTNPSFQSGGGAIFVSDVNLTLQNCNVSGNSADIGGGIRNDVSPSDIDPFASNLTINSSTVSGNTSKQGGGIANITTATVVDFPVGGAANLLINNSTISGNISTGEGGVFQNQLTDTTATTVINNSTIASNQADSDNAGGGNGGGVNNLAGTLTIKNTIVADNSVGSSGTGPDLSGNITSEDYNLFETTAGATISGATGNNITGVDPNLAPLASNGGFIQTQKPNAGSPAINAGDPTDCQNNNAVAVTSDQRGLPRNQGGVRCDIGAFEVGGIVWDGGGADNNFSTAANWENDTLPSSGDYIIFNSTSGKNITIDGAQIVGGVMYGGGYTGSMTIDGSGGGNLFVLETLYMYGGNINCINGGYLEIFVFGDLVRNTGFVNGQLVKGYLGSTTFTYPVGTGGNYEPVTITAMTNKSLGSFSVTANSGALTGVYAPGSLTMNWTFEASGITQASITVSYDDADVPTTANEDIFNFIRRSGMTNTEFAPTTADTFFNSFTLNNVSSFSDWALGRVNAPTAATASVSGRVTTSDGRGLANARVVLTDSSGNTISTITSSLGYYKLEDVQVGEDYIISVSAKRYRFAPQFITVMDEITDLNLPAQP